MRIIPINNSIIVELENGDKFCLSDVFGRLIIGQPEEEKKLSLVMEYTKNNKLGITTHIADCVSIELIKVRKDER